MKDVTEGESEYSQAKKLLRALDKDLDKKPSLPPDAQIKDTLWNYMSGIFKKTEEDYAFKKYIQELIMDRITEAPLEQVMPFYRGLNDHEVASTATSLMPFMPGKNAESSPLLDNIQQGMKTIEADVHQESDADTLRAFDQLSKLIGKVSSKKEV